MIRPAKETEHQMLTTISFASKGYWDYPKEYFEIWNDELTLSSDYIGNNTVFVYEKNDLIVGYYSIIEVRENVEVAGIEIHKGFWLEHMFILPSNIGQGIGTTMFHHLRKWCHAGRVDELNILADPNSRGFYEKMGCEYQREFPSTIPKRAIPWLVF